MSVHVDTIMLAVDDLTRAKRFYAEGLGGAVDQDHPGFVSISLGGGSSSLALYPRESAAKDAGLSPEGSGFGGVSFHYLVSTAEHVDQVIGDAVAAGGTVARPATASPWGYSAYFADPDGYLWKVASGA